MTYQNACKQAHEVSMGPDYSIAAAYKTHSGYGVCVGCYSRQGSMHNRALHTESDVRWKDLAPTGRAGDIVLGFHKGCVDYIPG